MRSLAFQFTLVLVFLISGALKIRGGGGVRRMGASEEAVMPSWTTETPNGGFGLVEFGYGTGTRDRDEDSGYGSGGAHGGGHGSGGGSGGNGAGAGGGSGGSDGHP
ncbi:hypothetical protein F511_10432 [Dorcoceras hygrometricum]|uniref:Uncharacterized protein n=1 Tax=Dorcoceras hygrometricum TaxID=472368 RepID=A0A2Z7C766_9LAMI|nr:hypothetical protein F511_10432 [Dorcoceras hygrometricum]